MDSVMNAAENKLNKGAQPGNSFEGSADNAVNQGMHRPFSETFCLLQG